MKSQRKSKKVSREPRARGLWIAPDLERKIKGEGGRRGLIDPPYSHYLHLADMALKNVPAAQPEAAAPSHPVLEVPKPPKLSAPKPAPTRQPKRPAKVSLPKLPQRPTTPKPPKAKPLPKPPRRRK